MRLELKIVWAVVLVMGMGSAVAQADWQEEFTAGKFPDIKTDGTGDWLALHNKITSYPGSLAGKETARLQFMGNPNGPALLVNNAMTGAGAYTAKVLLNKAKGSGVVLAFQDEKNYLRMLWNQAWAQGQSEGLNLNCGISIVEDGKKTDLNIGVRFDPPVTEFVPCIESTIKWDPAAKSVQVTLKYTDLEGKVLYEGSFKGAHEKLGKWQTGKFGVISPVNGNILHVDSLGFTAAAAADQPAGADAPAKAKELPQ
ncbi:MAG: hypothetical protein WD042_15010 [Phycisphaeraceae bacterium]